MTDNISVQRLCEFGFTPRAEGEQLFAAGCHVELDMTRGPYVGIRIFLPKGGIFQCDTMLKTLCGTTRNELIVESRPEDYPPDEKDWPDPTVDTITRVIEERRRSK
jgi:hypothetical protein